MRYVKKFVREKYPDQTPETLHTKLTRGTDTHQFRFFVHCDSEQNAIRYFDAYESSQDCYRP